MLSQRWTFRIHKLRARVRDDVIDKTVKELLDGAAELANGATPRLRQKELSFETLDGLLVSMRACLGELLATEDQPP